ncbi:MAG: hypothetical protein ACI8ZM_004882 [Crocinitomix sp.]|jgi:hypothetical protein
MKRQLLLLTFLFSCLSTFAQRTGDATFYSNTGKKFYVVLNGIKQNTLAQTNVNITGLSEPYYSCRIIAEDKSFNLEKNIGVKKDSLITYRIIEKKGKYKLRYYNESPLGTLPAPQDQVNVVYHNSDLPESNTTATNNGGSANTNTSTNVSTNTTTTSTSTNQNGTGENVSIDININEDNAGAMISIQGNVSDIDNGVDNGGAVVTSSSTETTTSSSSTTTTVNGVTTHSAESTTVTNTDNNGVTSHVEESTSVGSEGNIYTDENMTMTMSSGCGTTDHDVEEITAQINNAPFSEEKLKIAKLIASEKCMTVAQIKTISQLFNFDDNKMEFIKAAHTNCMNQSNYHQLMAVFNFADDKEELEKFIQSK